MACAMAGCCWSAGAVEDDAVSAGADIWIRLGWVIGWLLMCVSLVQAVKSKREKSEVTWREQLPVGVDGARRTFSSLLHSRRAVRERTGHAFRDSNENHPLE